MKKSINKLATLFAVAVLCICSLAVALPATSALAAEKDVSRMAELGNIKAAEFFVENDVCYQNYDLGYTRTQNGETRIVFGRNAVLAQDGVQTVLVDLLSVAKSEYYTSRPGELDCVFNRRGGLADCGGAVPDLLCGGFFRVLDLDARFKLHACFRGKGQICLLSLEEGG